MILKSVRVAYRDFARKFIPRVYLVIYSRFNWGFFQQNLVYVVDFYHKDSMACISENQTFEILVNITTERNKSPGSLFVQFPVDETPFSVHEYKIVHVGENLLPCFQSIQLDGSLDKFT